MMHCTLNHRPTPIEVHHSQHRTVEHATAGACGVHVTVQYVATVYETVYTQAHIVYMYTQHGDT